MKFNLSCCKKVSFSILIVLLFLSGLYAVGIFDAYLARSVHEKSYETGGFTYTGKLLDGKFTEEGEISFDDGLKCVGNFKDGAFSGKFSCTYGGCDIKGIFKDDNISNAEITQGNGRPLIQKEQN